MYTFSGLVAYLCKLPPIEVVTRVKLEDECVVDFGFLPNPTVQAEQECQE